MHIVYLYYACFAKMPISRIIMSYLFIESNVKTFFRKKHFYINDIGIQTITFSHINHSRLQFQPSTPDQHPAVTSGPGNLPRPGPTECRRARRLQPHHPFLGRRQRRDPHPQRGGVAQSLHLAQQHLLEGQQARRTGQRLRHHRLRVQTVRLQLRRDAAPQRAPLRPGGDGTVPPRAGVGRVQKRRHPSLPDRHP